MFTVANDVGNGCLKTLRTGVMDFHIASDDNDEYGRQ